MMRRAKHNLCIDKTNIVRTNAWYLSGDGIHGMRSNGVTIYLIQPEGDVLMGNRQRCCPSICFGNWSLTLKSIPLLAATAFHQLLLFENVQTATFSNDGSWTLVVWSLQTQTVHPMESSIFEGVSRKFYLFSCLKKSIKFPSVLQARLTNGCWLNSHRA